MLALYLSTGSIINPANVTAIRFDEEDGETATVFYRSGISTQYTAGYDLAALRSLANESMVFASECSALNPAHVECIFRNQQFGGWCARMVCSTVFAVNEPQRQALINAQ